MQDMLQAEAIRVKESEDHAMRDAFFRLSPPIGLLRTKINIARGEPVPLRPI
jgi:hypothetical protein